MSGWRQLNREMTLEPQNTHYGSDLDYDLMALPGWRNSSVQTRQRIISAGGRFLCEGRLAAPATEWGTLRIYYNDNSAYRAFRLLETEDRATYERLDQKCLA